LDERIPITIRLRAGDLVSLDRMARASTLTRQDMIEKIIGEALSAFGPFAEPEGVALPPMVLSAIESRVERMKPGEESSLKKLIGQELWATLDDPIRRGLGKVFKVLVDSGQFPALKLGRKKSNNEQQYNKS
jgi:hypothetical protein